MKYYTFKNLSLCEGWLFIFSYIYSCVMTFERVVYLGAMTGEQGDLFWIPLEDDLVRMCVVTCERIVYLTAIIREQGYLFWIPLEEWLGKKREHWPDWEGDLIHISSMVILSRIQ